MHTLTLFKSFTAKAPLTVNGRNYPAGVPLCVYVHKGDARTFIQLYDGPFIFIKNADYFLRLRSIGTTVEQAIQLSGWKPPVEQSLTLPSKPIVMPPPVPMMGGVKTIQPQQQNNITNTMAKKKKPTHNTPPVAPAASIPPPPGAPAAAIPPPPGAPAPAATPATDPVKPKEVQNGVTRPSDGTATGSVWDVADSITKQTGAPATRKAVVDACSAAGVNSSTATTQFGKWAKFHGHVGASSPGRPAGTPAAPQPATAPSNPTAGLDPAYQAGVDGYAAACRGENVVNPYIAGSTEAEQFTNGWTTAATQAAAQ